MTGHRKLEPGGRTIGTIFTRKELRRRKIKKLGRVESRSDETTMRTMASATASWKAPAIVLQAQGVLIVFGFCVCRLGVLFDSLCDRIGSRGGRILVDRAAI